MTMGLDRRKATQLNLDDAIEWETKTITSAVKTFFRNLPGAMLCSNADWWIIFDSFLLRADHDLLVTLSVY